MKKRLLAAMLIVAMMLLPSHIASAHKFSRVVILVQSSGYSMELSPDEVRAFIMAWEKSFHFDSNVPAQNTNTPVALIQLWFSRCADPFDPRPGCKPYEDFDWVAEYYRVAGEGYLRYPVQESRGNAITKELWTMAGDDLDRLLLQFLGDGVISESLDNSISGKWSFWIWMSLFAVLILFVALLTGRRAWRRRFSPPPSSHLSSVCPQPATGEVNPIYLKDSGRRYYCI